jgi:hypothetical protein
MNEKNGKFRLRRMFAVPIWEVSDGRSLGGEESLRSEWKQIEKSLEGQTMKVEAMIKKRHVGEEID